MIKKVLQFTNARLRAFTPIASFMSPRTDLLRGWARWRWLVRQRRGGQQIEPDVRIQGVFDRLDERLALSEGCHVDSGCIFWLGNEKGLIAIGARSYIGPYSFLGTLDHSLRIGANCMIGAHCYLITENHGVKRNDLPYRDQPYSGASITLGENVWLGARVTVLPGVSVGSNAIIGAGAVVTKDIPPNQVWAGVPARFVKHINRG